MKFGLIADIHGDFDSLEQALRLFDRQKTNQVLCAGDLVEKGSQGDAVVRLIGEQKIPCVLGNHDEAAPSNQRWFRDNADINHPNVHPRLLNAETITYLENLPRTLRFTVAGKNILLVHGTPTSNVDYLFSNNPPERFRWIAEQANADIIIFGHTHEAFQAYFDGVWFFNPDSALASNAATLLPQNGNQNHEDSKSSCATLTLPDCDFRVFNIETGQQLDVPFIT